MNNDIMKHLVWHTYLFNVNVPQRFKNTSRSNERRTVIDITTNYQFSVGIMVFNIISMDIITHGI